MESLFHYKGERNPKIISIMNPDNVLKFYYTKKQLEDFNVHSRFITEVKSMVRTDNRYTAVKKALYDAGLRRCQILGNLPEDSVPLEMHHMPLELDEIICIVLDHVLEEENLVSTWMIADLVLVEHENFNVPIAMLSETAHELVENGDSYIPYNALCGFFDKFVKRYYKGIRIEHYDHLKKYLKQSKRFGFSTDNDLFSIIERVGKYVKD